MIQVCLLEFGFILSVVGKHSQGECLEMELLATLS